MSPGTKAMILAAGYGQRARPLSLVRPKPLFPVLNQPLIDYTLELLAGVGVEEVVVNTHHLAERLEAHLARVRTGLRIRTRREPEILGTGGGVKNAAEDLGPEPFFLLNGDIWTEVDLKAVLAAHLARRPLATLVLHDHPRFNQVAVDSEGKIRGFRREGQEETGNQDWRELAFTGIHVLEPEVLAAMPPGPGDIIATYEVLLEQGAPVQAFIVDQPAWAEVGSLSAYLALHADLLGRGAEGPVLIGAGAEIDPEAVIQGWACLGPGARLGPGACLKDSVLWPGARVGPGVRVSQSVLADGATAERDVSGTAVVRQPGS